jgi:hypothetical protein
MFSARHDYDGVMSGVDSGLARGSTVSQGAVKNALFRWCLPALWLLAPPLLFPADEPEGLGHEIKASFVYTATKFIDWPTGAFTGADDPLVLGVLGEDPCGVALEKTVRGKTVHGRSVQVKRYPTVQDLEPSHVLFICASRMSDLPAVLTALEGRSVLTVSDADRFARLGGIMGLRLEENMVQFEVNVAAAGRAGLEISSKILRLGKVVKDRRPGGD